METSHKPTVSRDAARNMAIEMVAIALIALYALLSFGPLAGVFRGGDPTRIIVNTAFLVTSLWGFLVGSLIVSWLMTRDARKQDYGLSRRQAGAYAFVWCGLYLLYIHIGP